MGGHQVGEQGPNDDGYDEEGYDESQRAEILEVTRDGPTDGNLITDLAPDLGGEPLEDDGTEELPMTSDEIGEEDEDADDDEDDMDEDAAQADFESDDDDDGDDEISDIDDVALKP
jgi:DNA-directed RNA polymerase subunit delta